MNNKKIFSLDQIILMFIEKLSGDFQTILWKNNSILFDL